MLGVSKKKVTATDTFHHNITLAIPQEKAKTIALLIVFACKNFTY